MGPNHEDKAFPCHSFSVSETRLSIPSLSSPVHAWRIMLWDPEIPLTKKEAECLPGMLSEAFKTAGPCSVAFSSGPDRVLILLAHTTFTAPVYCDLAAWLCGHEMTDQCILRLHREGTLSLSRSFSDAGQWSSQDLLAMPDWWNTVSPILPSEAHRLRELLLTQLKRRHYDGLSACLLRILRSVKDPGPFCAGFVPVVVESVWSLYPDLPLRTLLDGLSLDMLTHRPQEAIQAWLSSLSAHLGICPEEPEAHDLEHIREVILQNPSLPYTQERLAHSLGLSPAYFSRIFHEQTGEPFSVFLTGARMKKAQELLREGTLSLQEISEKCGYPNKNYFSKVFRKYTGVSPSAYACQACAMSDSNDHEE